MRINKFSLSDTLQNFLCEVVGIEGYLETQVAFLIKFPRQKIGNFRKFPVVLGRSMALDTIGAVRMSFPSPLKVRRDVDFDSPHPPCNWAAFSNGREATLLSQRDSHDFSLPDS